MTIEEVKSVISEVFPDASIRNYFELESQDPIKCKGYSERGICILAYDGGYDISLRISFKKTHPHLLKCIDTVEFYLEVAGNMIVNSFVDINNVDINTYRYFLELVLNYKESILNLRTFNHNKTVPIRIIRNTTIESLIN